MKVRILSYAFLLAATCSCSARIEDAPKSDTLKTSGPGEVVMELPSVMFDVGTKTSAYVDETSGLKFKWEDGDEVGVYAEEGGYSRFTVTEGAGSPSALFDGKGFKLTPGKTYSALYPYESGDTDPSAVPLDYSSYTVTGVNDLGGLIPFDPLYASATADETGAAAFNFNHVTAFARLKCTMPSAGSYTRLDLLPTYGELTMDGSFNVQTGEWTPMNKSVVREIPLSGFSTSNSEKELAVWIPLAPQNNVEGDIASIIYDSEGKIYTSRLKGRDFKSGTAYKWDSEMTELTSSASGSGVSVSSTKESSLSNLPSGEYSGITQISETRYAVVHDKAGGSGFYFFDLEFNKYGSVSSSSCTIPSGTSSENGSRDPEGIAFFPQRNTLFVSGEGDQQILEYDMDGTPTGRSLKVPEDMSKGGISGNAGFEALDYNDVTKTFWTTTESNLVKDGSYSDLGGKLLRLQSFKSDLSASDRFFYVLDNPQKSSASARNYAFGVPDILALDDGRLLIIEREAYIPNGNYLEIAAGTVVYLKLYEVDPVHDKGGVLSKKLVKSITVSGALGFANYEGICFGPVINGKRTLLMISDSQSRYYDVLQDWLMVLFVSGI